MPPPWRPAPLTLPPARPPASRTCAPTADTCPPARSTDQRGGPNASTDADPLAAHRSSASAVDGGREGRPETAEASPNHAVHHAQAGPPLQASHGARRSSRPEPSARVAGRLCPASGRRSLSAGDCRVRTEPMESPARNIHPAFGCLRRHGRLLQVDTRRSTSSRDVGGQTGGHTDARGCRGQGSGGGRVGATGHPHERVQKGCPCSAPSQPRIGSCGQSEALQRHRR